MPGLRAMRDRSHDALEFASDAPPRAFQMVARLNCMLPKVFLLVRQARDFFPSNPEILLPVVVCLLVAKSCCGCRPIVAMTWRR